MTRGCKMSKEEIEELTKEEKLTLVEKGHLFCARTFFTGLVRKFVNFIFETILSAEFLVLILFSVAFFQATSIDLGLWIVYGVVCVIFIIAKPLKHLINEKTTLNMNASFGANASINKNM